MSIILVFVLVKAFIDYFLNNKMDLFLVWWMIDIRPKICSYPHPLEDQGHKRRTVVLKYFVEALDLVCILMGLYDFLTDD